MKSIAFFHYSTYLLLCAAYSAESKESSAVKEELKSVKLPPCAACKLLVESFNRGIERTKRGKFEGGDSAWEEDKLGSYAKSEVRLVEIQENVCNDVDRGQIQCHSLAEELESAIEQWWFKHQDTQFDLYTYVCIEQAKRCCPKDHFGPDCTECPGYPDDICNNNGKCKGAGTRKGNGECFCDRGYTGKNCSECASGYHQSYKDDTKILCSKCHVACDGPCHGPGPRDCEKCAKGWTTKVEDRGCYDLDECLHSETCAGNKFCVNNEGSYTCLDCDKACNGCTGDGPDMCKECAEGFHKKNNACINSDLFGRKRKENMARYATYFGLCIATCIILQRNVYAASVIGLLVSIYISVSEYMIAYSNVQDTSTTMDVLGPAD